MLDKASPIIPVLVADIKEYNKKKEATQHKKPHNNLLLFLYSSNSFLDFLFLPIIFTFTIYLYIIHKKNSQGNFCRGYNYGQIKKTGGYILSSRFYN